MKEEMQESRFVSVLGDSISTFAEVSPPGGVYYAPSAGPVTGVRSAEDTWWMRAIRGLGGTLLRNDSWSGSTVSPGGAMPAGSPSRIRRLATGEHMPDVVLVMTGLNDVNGSIDPSIFARAYEEMLHRLRTAYPSAAIWCATLVTGYLGETPFWQAFSYFRSRLDPYNAAIRRAALCTGCHVADLAAAGVQYASLDGLHPSGEGMSQLAAAWLRCMGVGSDEKADRI